MTTPNENHPWRKYTTNIDIVILKEMLIEKGFSVSTSYVSKYVRLNKIPGFYKVTVKEYPGYKWYISREDAKKFVKSFDYFGKNKK